MASFKRFIQIGMALDPIHIGTGGARIGRVDLTITREPATRLPKIPGSSLAGVYRAYVAMAETETNPNRQIKGKDWPCYPHCAGLGQSRESYYGHCGQPDCPVCIVFGFARGKDHGMDQAHGFAGLAAFSDAHIFLFPVPTRRGPYWITCPLALRLVDFEVTCAEEDAVYLGKLELTIQKAEQQFQQPGQQASPLKLNLGWLYLEMRECQRLNDLAVKLKSLKVPQYIVDRIALLSDYLFIHVVNSNLEVRTSVSINPETGAAEEGALFSYEALPRATILVWEIIAKNPKHFKVGGKDIGVILESGKMDDPDKVHQIVQRAHPYLEYLGIGGMGTRGMGRLKVLCSKWEDGQSKEVAYQNIHQLSASQTEEQTKAPADFAERP